MISKPLFAIALVCCRIALATEDLDAPLSLPEVDTLLSEASDTVDLFNTQTNQVQSIVTKQQEDSRKAVAAQKEMFEMELDKMQQNNTDMMTQNDRVRSDISNLREGNSRLLKQAEKMEKGSTLMRDALIALEPKMAVAKSFVSDSLNKTNLTGHKALKVLDAPVPEPTLSHFLSVVKTTLASTQAMEQKSQAAEIMSQETVSLLETSGRLRASAKKPESTATIVRSQANSAEELVGTLSSSIANLDAAQEQGLAQLKANFLAMSEVRTNRYKVLFAEQQVLNESRANMVTLQEQLFTARAHLNKTIDELKKRIDGIRVFAQTANKTAGAAIDFALLAHPANTSMAQATALLASLNALPEKMPTQI